MSANTRGANVKNGFQNRPNPPSSELSTHRRVCSRVFVFPSSWENSWWLYKTNQQDPRLSTKHPLGEGKNRKINEEKKKKEEKVE